MPSIEHADVDADAAQKSNFVTYNSSFLRQGQQEEICLKMRLVRTMKEGVMG